MKRGEIEKEEGDKNLGTKNRYTSKYQWGTTVTVATTPILAKEAKKSSGH